MSTQFVKSPPTPADSELWKIGTKWRRSQTKNVDYTELNNISTKLAEIDIETLLEGLNDQLAGRQKQSISYVGHLLVASYTPDGKVFVYGFTPDREAEADKKASFNTGLVPEGANDQQRPQQQQHLQFRSPTQQQQQQQQSSTISTNTTKPTFTKKTIDAPFDMIALAIDDKEGIAAAIEQGLYPLRVVDVGVENFNYISEETGKRTFLYGRLKSVEVG